VHRTATISIFLSVAKCGSICRAQTCAHSGVEPSRSAKAFLPKTLDKNTRLATPIGADGLSGTLGTVT